MKNTENIKKEIIWNNTNIKNDNKTLLYKSWLDKGIKNIEHIFDSRLKIFFTFQHMKTTYNLNTSDFLKYHTLIQSIPQSWKIKLKNENNQNNDIKNNLLEQISKLKSANKYFYNKQLNKVAENLVIKPHVKWEQEMIDINWKIVHTLPCKSIINTKLRAFQYKYLMKILPNNRFLYKCNITSASLCDFCNMYIESNKHLFCECLVSRSFWTELEVFLNEKRININLNYQTISLGLMDQSRYSNLLNCILIYAKYFIFKNKYTKTEPTFNNFKKYLKYHEQFERLISVSKDKI